MTDMTIAWALFGVAMAIVVGFMAARWWGRRIRAERERLEASEDDR